MNWLSTGILTVWLTVAGWVPSATNTQLGSTDIVVPEKPAIATSQNPAKIEALTKAQGVQITDMATGTTLYARDANTARPMASLTKLMTAYLILSTHKLDEKVMVPKDVLKLSGTNSQTIGLAVGDTMTVEQALKTLLIYSANDAAVTLAVFDAGSEATFVQRMNEKAQDLGMTSTRFVNPHGLDADGHVSSPADLSRLARAVMTSKTAQAIVRTRSTSITTGQGNVLRLTTTNQLLQDKLVQGVKTGFTEKAGQCLITYDTDGAGRAIITVMLNSPDRFAETSRVVHYLLD